MVNRRGDTADDIHAFVCKDVADYDGMAIHVNYNMFADIVEVQHIPFENCRLLEEDEIRIYRKNRSSSGLDRKENPSGKKP